jgi:predicted peptidase
MRIATILILLLPLTVVAQTTQPMTRTTGQWQYLDHKKTQLTGPYLAFTPATWDGKTPLPLVIFLHGAGSRGTDGRAMETEFLVEQITAGRQFEAIVLFPQVSTYWNGTQAASFIDLALNTYDGKHDPDRVYLMGESSGGGGCWEGAKLRADKLAAAVPIATITGRADDADKLVNLPIWAFHNVHDPYQVVDKSRTQVNAIKALGGKYVVYTEYTATAGKFVGGKWPNTHKHAWETALTDPALWEWMWRQRRGKPELALNPPPTTQRGP